MNDVNVTELRQNLPEYLAQVAKGERIRVTHRGRVIAEISPPTPVEDVAAMARARLAGSLVKMLDPTEPVLAPDEWDMNR